MRFLNIVLYLARLLLVGAASIFLLTRSTPPPGDITDRIRAYTRDIEFDYVDWSAAALLLKINQGALGAGNYLDSDVRREAVFEYLRLVSSIQRANYELTQIYADPTIPDPDAASALLQEELAEMNEYRNHLAPVAESILQDQIAVTVAKMGLTVGGQPVPPVLYHSTPLPWALIVSPRDTIRQEADISLDPNLAVADHNALEEQVDQALNLSSLVVPIGGVGVYPTMVQQTSNLEWLSETVAHEWVHNFLTLRPLGMSYLSSPELRIMNETTASIAGQEIGRAVLETYYPELVPPPAPSPPPAVEEEAPEPSEPVFDFIEEMRETRVTVDELLAEGKIEEAEEYMEQRRVLFWENGYRSIRKLNQAYFAFYGAYADHPRGGAAGTDPVGAAVRQLRAQSPTLEVFLKRIAWMTSFEQLDALVKQQASLEDE